MTTKKYGICEIKRKDCECCREYKNVMDNLREYKCLCCNKNSPKKFNENLSDLLIQYKSFLTMTLKKIILLSQNGVYLYEYIDDWEKFNETSLHEKEDSCGNLNMEDITDANYTHTERVCKDFEKKIRRIS